MPIEALGNESPPMINTVLSPQIPVDRTPAFQEKYPGWSGVITFLLAILSWCISFLFLFKLFVVIFLGLQILSVCLCITCCAFFVDIRKKRARLLMDVSIYREFSDEK